MGSNSHRYAKTFRTIILYFFLLFFFFKLLSLDDIEQFFIDDSEDHVDETMYNEDNNLDDGFNAEESNNDHFNEAQCQTVNKYATKNGVKIGNQLKKLLPKKTNRKVTRSTQK